MPSVPKPGKLKLAKIAKTPGHKQVKDKNTLVLGYFCLTVKPKWTKTSVFFCLSKASAGFIDWLVISQIINTAHICGSDATIAVVAMQSWFHFYTSQGVLSIDSPEIIELNYCQLVECYKFIVEIELNQNGGQRVRWTALSLSHESWSHESTEYAMMNLFMCRKSSSSSSTTLHVYLSSSSLTLLLSAIISYY